MHPCRYAILRFLPYVEKGEFANVGVVLISTTGNFFGFRLLEKQLDRLTNFFNIKDTKPLRDGLRLMQQELDRIQTRLNQTASESVVSASNAMVVEAAFAELTRPRETLFRFDAPRVLLAEAPAADLDRLFGLYVERDSANEDAREKLLEDTASKVA